MKTSIKDIRQIKKTVGRFRVRLIKIGLVEELFEQFTSFFEARELLFNQGQLIDASFTIVPRQRNTRKENEKIKNGERHDLWNDKPHKKCHKDMDACWTKKNNETFCGYFPSETTIFSNLWLKFKAKLVTSL